MKCGFDCMNVGRSEELGVSGEEKTIKFLFLKYLCGNFVPHLNPMIMKASFADFIRDKRVSAGLTLREFCRIINFDASNWSKVERGLSTPPQSRNVLENISDVLKIEKDSEEYKELFDLAALASIPEGLIESEIIQQLPAFFRTVRGEKPTEEELRNLIKKIRSSWTPEKRT
jgi:transcriptional regulator with XRE-family HTH domain